MKRTGESVYQSSGINQIIEFIRSNALAEDIGSRPVITSKGEQFLQILSHTAARSNSGMSGAL
jgi:hypothetical protein